MGCIQVDSSRTRQHGGSGLGLAICKRLVEAMGGKMWATSDGAARGSTFHFCIRCPKFTGSPQEEAGEDAGSEPEMPGSPVAAAPSDAADSLAGTGLCQSGPPPAAGSKLQGYILDMNVWLGVLSAQSPTPLMHAAEGESCTSECAALPEAAQGCAQEPPQQPQSGPASDGGKSGGIARLRQVLSNILPGGSKSPGMSADASGELEDSLAPPRAASLPKSVKSVAAARPAGRHSSSADWQPSSPEGSHSSLAGIKASRNPSPCHPESC